MALYERYISGQGAPIERAFTVDGSERDTELAMLAHAGTGGWERIAGPGVQQPADPTRPAQSAPKETWVEWAVFLGAGRAEAEATKKPDLIAAYGKDPADPDGSDPEE